MNTVAKIRRGFRIQPLLLLVILLAGSLSLAASAPAHARASAKPLFTWRLEMDVPAPTVGLTASATLDESRAQLESVLASKLPGTDISRTIDEITLDGRPGLEVILQGTSDDANLRQTLFSSLSPDFDVLGGPMDVAIAGHARRGQILSVSLESRPSTGYGWQIAPDSAADVISTGGFVVHQKTQSLGAPSTATVILQSAADAESAVRLEYRRPWEAQAAATRRLLVQAAAWPDALDLTNPMLPPSEVADSSTIQNGPPLASLVGLPSSWDWRSQGAGLTPIRNQGTCGSCWAFGTVGVFESAIRLRTGVSTDLSEQFLVSCNTYGYSCNGGWWGAHDFHTDRLGSLQSQIGAANESDMPYTATNGTCQTIANHPYRQSAWYYVASGSGVPTPDQIKNAIFTYGPVGVALCVGSAFQAYRSNSGIFSTDESATCGASIINHAVVLVGWDDNGGDGYWILRNSWGTGWGQNGYMRIKWGTSKVGYAANYVIFMPPDMTPRVYLPYVRR